MSMDSVVSRMCCTGAQRTRRGTWGSVASLMSSKKPMRVLMPCRATVRLRVGLAVLRWHWPCAVIRRWPRNSPRRLRNFLQTQPSGMPSSYRRFKP